MTETLPASQDDVKSDSSQPPSSTKVKSKDAVQGNDSSDRPKTTEKIEKPPTKVVVRRLPPTMTLETFLDQVAPLPPVDYMYFVKADFSLTPNSFSRAYLHFVHVADLLIFTEKFDNYVFVDSKGNEYPAIVEYAPFQRIPKQRSTRKRDPRIGTIESDPYYLEFIEALKIEETQRKSASKTNKQHFFETSTSSSTPKVTSTPLLEFLKARRADKLRTKEDKMAERRKREMERRKAREDARISIKHTKASDVEGDSSTVTQPMKIAAHGMAIDKISKETLDNKRSSKEFSVKENSGKRREDERNKTREKDKDNKKERERESREHQREQKRDARRDSIRDQGSVYDKEKDKENQLSTAEAKPRETRRGGKSYQEERQRLNERRLAAKGLVSKPSLSSEGNDKHEKGDETVNEEVLTEKKHSLRKDPESNSDLRNRTQDKFYKNSDQYRQPSSRDGKRFEKPGKPVKEQEQRRGSEARRHTDDRHTDDGKETKKSLPVEKSTTTEDIKSQPVKEETRKKSYNQEREQRRAAAADRRNQNRGDSSQTGKGDEKASAKDESVKRDTASDSNEIVKVSGEGENSGNNPQRNSNTTSDNVHNSGSKSKSKSELPREFSELRKKESSGSKSDEKDKKDPRAERRIRNKDRPSIEIYRPGMGRFSRQRLEREKVLGKGSSTERDSPSPSPSPVPSAAMSSVIPEKALEETTE